MEREDPGATGRRRSMVTMVNEQLTVGRLHQRLFGRGREGPTVGRYHVVRPLDQGSMGSVYVARDPDLDRDVALKLYRPRDETHPIEGAEDRLWREAQLLARVSDPNVVAVHEVGRLEDGTVFVAMELVRGVTLRAWLDAHPEAGWRRAAELVEAAGRGLMAVHAAGVLHRDLKPTNILVGQDGRVRLVDFGLARATDGPRPEPPPRSAGGDDEVVRSDAAGTPAYMAPEQHYGASVDTRTDVYSLCMVLFEAVFGGRPFGGTSPEVLPRQKLDAEIEWVERRGRVPRALRSVLNRGLDPDPAARFASAEELVRALSRVLRRRRLVWTAGAAVLAAGVVVGVGLSDTLESRACRDAGAELVASWDAPARERIEGAFGASGTDLARQEGALTADAFDDYAAALSQARVATCADGAAGPELTGYREACLEARSHELEILVAELGTPRDDLVSGGRDAVRELPDPGACMQPGPDRLQAWVALGPEGRERFHGFLPALARARALHHAGDLEGALASVDEALATAKDLPAHSLTARAHYVRGQILQRLGRFAESEKAAREAILAAGEAGDPALAARAWSVMIFSVGVGQHRFDEALAHEVAARAALSQVSAPEVVAGPLLEMALGSTLAVQGDYGGAAKRFDQLADEIPDLTPSRRMLIHHNLALLNHEIGQSARALEHAQLAHGLALEVHGPRHPSTARMMLSVINALRGLDRAEEAIDRAREVVSGLTPVDGGGPPTFDLVLARMFLGLTLIEGGRLMEATEVLENAHDEAMRLDLGVTVEPSILLMQGVAACQGGDRAEGVARLERALEKLRAIGQAPRRDEVDNLVALARCERERGNLDRAREWVQAAERVGLPGSAAAMSRLDLLEERARLELARGRLPAKVLEEMDVLRLATDRTVTAGLVELLRGQAALQEGRVPEAGAHAARAIELFSGNDAARVHALREEAQILADRAAGTGQGPTPSGPPR